MTYEVTNDPSPATPEDAPLADLPLIREDLLVRIEQLRAAGAPPDQIAPLVEDYDHYTALGRRG